MIQNVPKMVRIKVEDTKELKFMPIGDCHIGASTHDPKTLKKVINRALEERAYVLLCGDLVNLNLRNSKGSVYEDTLSPEHQLEAAIETFMPLADAGLLLGSLSGNHEDRCTREVGISAMRYIAKGLRTEDLGPNAIIQIVLPDSTWNIFAAHGSGGGGTQASKASKLEKLALLCPLADIILVGHVHADVNFTSQTFRPNNSGVGVHLRHHFVTGSTQSWGGYAATNNMQPNRTGSWLLTLSCRDKDKSQPKKLFSEFIY